ncbi:hypothetical protein JTB14_018958 [Gonioctena quinquepunctata]|nr:hypothetical protein JTB14_018958 [Gonioctena quinquepunctata]
MAFIKVIFFALFVVATNAGVLPAVSHPIQYSAAPVQYSAAPVQYAAAPTYTNVATPVQYAAAPAYAKVAVNEDYDPNPQYQYGYDVQDDLTGDSKSQTEQRQGDSVQGSYSVVDPDGHKRTVDYTADPIHGFNAVVRREPLHVKTVPTANVAYSTPNAYTQAYNAPAYHH